MALIAIFSPRALKTALFCQQQTKTRYIGDLKFQRNYTQVRLMREKRKKQSSTVYVGKSSRSVGQWRLEYIQCFHQDIACVLVVERVHLPNGWPIVSGQQASASRHKIYVPCPLCPPHLAAVWTLPSD